MVSKSHTLLFGKLLLPDAQMPKSTFLHEGPSQIQSYTRARQSPCGTASRLTFSPCSIISFTPSQMLVPKSTHQTPCLRISLLACTSWKTQVITDTTDLNLLFRNISQIHYPVFFRPLHNKVLRFQFFYSCLLLH